MRRAYRQRVTMNHSRQHRCFVAVQRFPQLESFCVELFQFDDVVVLYVAGLAQVADWRPVCVEPATVVQPSVGQKTNELDERNIMFSTVAYRRSSSVSVAFYSTIQIQQLSTVTVYLIKYKKCVKRCHIGTIITSKEY